MQKDITDVVADWSKLVYPVIKHVAQNLNRSVIPGRGIPEKELVECFGDENRASHQRV